MQRLGPCAILFLMLTGPLHASEYMFGMDGVPILCVPEENIAAAARSLTHSSLNLKPEADVRLAVVFQFVATEIGGEIREFRFDPDYNSEAPVNSIRGLVNFISDERKKISIGRAAGPDVERIWQRSKPCDQAIIVQVPETTNFLAKCNASSALHIIFDRLPDPKNVTEDPYDTVLATCYRTKVSFGPHMGRELENCTRRFLLEGLEIDYEFQIYNAPLINKMDEFLRGKIRGWKRNCHR